MNTWTGITCLYQPFIFFLLFLLIFTQDPAHNKGLKWMQMLKGARFKTQRKKNHKKTNKLEALFLKGEICEEPTRNSSGRHLTQARSPAA